MATKNINGRDYIFVEVPEGAIKFKISGTGYLCYKMGYTNGWDNTSNVWNTSFDDKLPEGEFTIIGLASSLSEEQWAGIVETDNIVDEIGGMWNWFKNYSDVNKPHEFPTESGLSLLSSLGMKPGTTLLLIKEK